MEPSQTSTLPENASRELREGETYEPLMSPHKRYPEVNFWSVGWGLVMAVIFSAAAAYLGLKVGQVFEAAIPIAIIALGLSSAAKRKGALGENVIIQSIGASSGLIVAGAIFTLPALYILQAKYPEMTVSFWQIFFSSLLGGCLGILFLIPFRKYFVSDMHGKYPFPEATATTQVLASGARAEAEGEAASATTSAMKSVAKSSSAQTRLLLVAGLVGGLYDFAIAKFGAWSEVFSTRAIAAGDALAEKAKIVFKLNLGSAVLGLGYIVGLKYAAIICAGSFVSWYVFIPLLAYFADGQTLAVGTGVAKLVGAMSAEEIFKYYVRNIGIGGIAMAGVVGIIRSSGVIKSAVKLAGRELGGGKGAAVVQPLRTQRDLPMKIILWGIAACLLLVFVFFWIGVTHSALYALVGLLVVALIAFLFTTVAANAIAIVGTNPVSGMTLMTLIIASLILAGVGLSGTSGMVAALVIGGVVCTALAMAGGFVTDLKIGYWLGSTPAKQQSYKFLGTLVSAATVGGVMMVLNQTYGFTGDNALVAPQANAMAAVIEPLMSGQSVPWLLYGAGAALALILTMIGVPALAFALGMFIPLDLNTPLLVGGLVNWFVTTRSKNAALNAARGERGTLVASGFIAGGALLGVLSAVLSYFKIDYVNAAWSSSHAAQMLGLVVYAGLVGYFVWESMRKNLKI
ncbi:MAG: oligopeptide transporter, OPT family [Prevotellaceae bacterium]|jgi:putative OPT family oligopeptide transporter|nr:oligopeptide transporter, OPT family [Prevotellaceae bacterium]